MQYAYRCKKYVDSICSKLLKRSQCISKSRVWFVFDKRRRFSCTDLPSVELSSGDADLIGWPGELRNVTCFGRGLPLPNVQWLYRGGQQVTDNAAFTVVTSRTNVTVTSHLQVSSVFVTEGKGI